MDIGILLTIPSSTLAILAVAIGIDMTSALLYSKFVDQAKLKEVRAKMGALNKEMFAARKKGDKKALAKLQRQQKQMMAESGKVMQSQSKVMLIQMLPFLGVYYLLSAFFGAAGAVAFAPFELPFGIGTQLPFWVWYMLAALGMGIPINKKFGLYR